MVDHNMAFVDKFCKECGSRVVKEVVKYNCPLCGWRSEDQVYPK